MAVPPTLRSFDLNLLVLFDVLYRERKLGSAATAVGLSQPGASQALARLREVFDDPLFERRGNGMDPTPHAHTLAPLVREALAALERGLTALRSFDPSQSDRVFKLGLAELGEVAVFPALVAKLSQLAPGIRLSSIRGSRSDVHLAALKRDVDLAVDFEPPDDASLQHRIIAEEELVVIARLDHPRARGTISREQFFEERHVVVDLDPGAKRRAVETVRAPPMTHQRALCVCSHWSSVPGVVMQTDAIATVPRALVSSSLYAGRVQILTHPFPLLKLPVCVYWHESLDADPGHAWLRSHVLERFWAPLES